uniref:Copper transport protein n=1 Tax=Leersia perrieri TaxID=77586 RepID=A0A0D9VUF6_9ORYZ
MAMPMPMPPPGPGGDTPAPSMPGMSMPTPTGMSFWWGHRAVVLFSGWPGDRAGAGMYILCLLVVLTLAALVEALSAAAASSRRRHARRLPAAALLAAAVHAAKMGLAYLVMLAVMSFNAGVLLAAVAGHFAGFLLARSGLLGPPAATHEEIDGDGTANGSSLHPPPSSEPKP